MNDTIKLLGLHHARARHRRSVERLRTLATVTFALACIATGISLMCSCRLSTPAFGLGFNPDTGFVGVTIGPMDFGSVTNAPSK